MVDEFDEEALRIASRYCGYDFKNRRAIEEEVFHEHGDEEWTLTDFQGIIAKAVKKIPEEYLGTAVVEVKGDEYSSSLRITYTRLEYDSEVEARVRRAAAYVRKVRAQELAAFEALKRKYEPNA